MATDNRPATPSVAHRDHGPGCQAVLVAFAGCRDSSGSPAPTGGPGPAVQARQITVDGVARSYRIYAPPTLGTRSPSALVIVLHGGNDSAVSMVGSTTFARQAEVGNFVVAYPEGTRLEWDAGFVAGRRLLARSTMSLS